jgi:hypothetical protein
MISTAAKNYALDGLLQATLTASLHTADPGATGANEVSGGGYARASITFSAAGNGQSATSAAVTWLNLPAVTVTHVGIWRGGVFLFGAPLTQSRTVQAGDGLYMVIGTLTVQVS